MEQALPTAAKSFSAHRVSSLREDCVSLGVVRWAPLKSLWFLGMAAAAMVGGIATFTWAACALFIVSTAIVLLFGHSLGSHRKLIHNSFQCPRWLEYVLVYLGVQVGLAGPLSLLRPHELRVRCASSTTKPSARRAVSRPTEFRHPRFARRASIVTTPCAPADAAAHPAAVLVWQSMDNKSECHSEWAMATASTSAKLTTHPHHTN